MNFAFRFAYPLFMYVGVGVIIAALLIRRYWPQTTKYRYSLASTFSTLGYKASSWPISLQNLLRSALLIFLAALAARPQLVDVQSKIPVEGIDIMMVLDASGSMQCFDDLQDQRSRFEVAKTEAINFIERRENDQIGLVIFGRDAVSRIPLTIDKKISTEIIKNLELGTVNPDGTALGVAMAMAARRLQQSKAKSKVMIVLTDGEPTPEIDIDPQTAVDLAKKLGIKIYTIGIGGEHGGLFHDPLFGIRSMGFRLNSTLLRSIAEQTGGSYFEAHRPHELHQIYAHIDALEKTAIEATIFSTYHELLVPVGCAAAIALLLELLARLIWVVL
ncbi:MAG TPA: VWA domain-containing protein [Candidatus Babeliales bacterium]|nr:VWA domain-containing protein [Candidatus Babeliales bacterium]